jgi:uncharacterized protein YrrD
LVNPDSQATVARVEIMVREQLKKLGRRASFIPLRRPTLVNSKAVLAMRGELLGLLTHFYNKTEQTTVYGYRISR